MIFGSKSLAMAAPALSSVTPLDAPILVDNEELAPALDLCSAYEVDSTCAQILQGGYKIVRRQVMTAVRCLTNEQVALQFPDPLLHDAVPVYKAIRSTLPLEIEVYVLADTTFGSCVPSRSLRSRSADAQTAAASTKWPLSMSMPILSCTMGTLA